MKCDFEPTLGLKVRLQGCPLDLQIEEEQSRFEEIFAKTQTITAIKVVAQPCPFWIKTDVMPDWTSAAWFRTTKDK